MFALKFMLNVFAKSSETLFLLAPPRLCFVNYIVINRTRAFRIHEAILKVLITLYIIEQRVFRLHERITCSKVSFLFVFDPAGLDRPTGSNVLF